jgi:hypothetical protein
MFARIRILALALPALGLFAAFLAMPSPADAATTCNPLTFGTTTLTDCSEVFTITQPTPGTFAVTASFPAGNGGIGAGGAFNANGYEIGIVNNSGVSIFDLELSGHTGAPIFNIVPSETLCFSSMVPASCAFGASNGHGGTVTGNEGKILQNGDYVYFTAIGTANGTTLNFGDVNFTGGLPAGDVAVFALTNLAIAGCVTNAAGVCVPTVPEPATFLIFIGGMVGFGLWRRRWLAGQRGKRARMRSWIRKITAGCIGRGLNPFVAPKVACHL